MFLKQTDMPQINASVRKELIEDIKGMVPDQSSFSQTVEDLLQEAVNARKYTFYKVDFVWDKGKVKAKKTAKGRWTVMQPKQSTTTRRNK